MIMISRRCDASNEADRSFQFLALKKQSGRKSENSAVLLPSALSLDSLQSVLSMPPIPQEYTRP